MHLNFSFDHNLVDVCLLVVEWPPGNMAMALVPFKGERA
jgi:hypothetical protein